MEFPEDTDIKLLMKAINNIEVRMQWDKDLESAKYISTTSSNTLLWH